MSDNNRAFEILAGQDVQLKKKLKGSNLTI